MEAQEYLSTLFSLENDTRIEQLEQEIAFLFHHRFERLLWVLYRLDVSEQKLNTALTEASQPEEKIITQLLLERCHEIVANRESFNANSTDSWSFDLDDEE